MHENTCVCEMCGFSLRTDPPQLSGLALPQGGAGSWLAWLAWSVGCRLGANPQGSTHGQDLCSSQRPNDTGSVAMVTSQFGINRPLPPPIQLTPKCLPRDRLEFHVFSYLSPQGRSEDGESLHFGSLHPHTILWLALLLLPPPHLYHAGAGEGWTGGLGLTWAFLPSGGRWSLPVLFPQAYLLCL